MHLRTVAMAAAAGALLTAAASSAHAATPTARPDDDTRTDDRVALIQGNTPTPWSVVDFALTATQE
ncbi:hypothetical protein [Streptomyces sp. NPDC047928]|uniref:hypothetical protein n=1 Tax=unclassified Streptomyces TaxID=2593676 RepID=UPI0037175AAC